MDRFDARCVPDKRVRLSRPCVPPDFVHANGGAPFRPRMSRTEGRGRSVASYERRTSRLVPPLVATCSLEHAASCRPETARSTPNAGGGSSHRLPRSEHRTSRTALRYVHPQRCHPASAFTRAPTSPSAAPRRLHCVPRWSTRNRTASASGRRDRVSTDWRSWRRSP